VGAGPCSGVASTRGCTRAPQLRTQGQRRSRDREAGAINDPFVLIDQQMVGTLDHQHVLEQAGERKAVVYCVRRNGLCSSFSQLAHAHLPRTRRSR
jgi:hypothetical protein